MISKHVIGKNSQGFNDIGARMIGSKMRPMATCTRCGVDIPYQEIFSLVHTPRIDESL
jgi:uncharacterized protein (DUF342 family)